MNKKWQQKNRSWCLKILDHVTFLALQLLVRNEFVVITPYEKNMIDKYWLIYAKVLNTIDANN